MPKYPATARSNKVATTLAVQDFSQLKKDYGAEQADVITGIVGNVISGQVSGDTAKTLSEGFGKIMQDRSSLSIGSSDTSTSKSSQLDYAVPATKIAGLSSGEFVGMVADNPDQKIKLKMFHAEIQNDHAKLAKEESLYQAIPIIEEITTLDVQENYLRIKKQVNDLVNEQLSTLIDPKPIIEKKNQLKIKRYENLSRILSVMGTRRLKKISQYLCDGEVVYLICVYTSISG